MNKMLFALLCGSIGFNFYFINAEVLVEDTLDHESIEVNDEISVAQSSISKVPHSGPTKRSTKIFEKIESAGSTSEEFLLDDSYDDGKGKWKSAAKDFFEYELKLSESKHSAYVNISNQRRIEIDEFTLALTKKSRVTPYLFTIEDNIAISEINKRFLSKLKIELGERAFIEYKDFLKKYNQKLIETNKIEQTILF